MKSHCIAVVCAFLLVFLCSGCDSYETSDVENYGNYSGHIQGEETIFHHTLLSVFPDTPTAQTNAAEYYYRCDEGMNNGYVLYLQCSFSQSDYEAEISRLQDLSVCYSDILSSSYLAGNYTINSELQAKGYTGDELSSLQQKLLFDTSAFSFPAYIAVYEHMTDNHYEYALADDENCSVIYVANFANDLASEQGIPEEYKPQRDIELPANFINEIYGGYSIYDFRTMPKVSEAVD